MATKKWRMACFMGLKAFVTLTEDETESQLGMLGLFVIA